MNRRHCLLRRLMLTAGITVLQIVYTQDLFAQHRQVARLANHLLADLFEGLADLAVSGTESGARQSLMFPYPGVLKLVFGKCGDRAHQQAALAIRAQAQIDFIQAS